jgi:hypothetical protein
MVLRDIMGATTHKIQMLVRLSVGAKRAEVLAIMLV